MGILPTQENLYGLISDRCDSQQGNRWRQRRCKGSGKMLAGMATIQNAETARSKLTVATRGAAISPWKRGIPKLDTKSTTALCGRRRHNNVKIRIHPEKILQQGQNDQVTDRVRCFRARVDIANTVAQWVDWSFSTRRRESAAPSEPSRTTRAKWSLAAIIRGWSHQRCQISKASETRKVMLSTHWVTTTTHNPLM